MVALSIAELCRNGGDEERFLLASASLANLSFLAPEAIEIMREIATAQVLIRTARNHQMIVFAKDQVRKLFSTTNSDLFEAFPFFTFLNFYYYFFMFHIN
jgi:hypothetical protein